MATAVLCTRSRPGSKIPAITAMPCVPGGLGQAGHERAVQRLGQLGDAACRTGSASPPGRSPGRRLGGGLPSASRTRSRFVVGSSDDRDLAQGDAWSRPDSTRFGTRSNQVRHRQTHSSGPYLNLASHHRLNADLERPARRRPGPTTRDPGRVGGEQGQRARMTGVLRRSWSAPSARAGSRRRAAAAQPGPQEQQQPGAVRGRAGEGGRVGAPVEGGRGAMRSGPTISSATASAVGRRTPAAATARAADTPSAPCPAGTARGSGSPRRPSRTAHTVSGHAEHHHRPGRNETGSSTRAPKTAYGRSTSPGYTCWISAEDARRQPEQARPGATHRWAADQEQDEADAEQEREDRVEPALEQGLDRPVDRVRSGRCVVGVLPGVDQHDPAHREAAERVELMQSSSHKK